MVPIAENVKRPLRELDLTLSFQRILENREAVYGTYPADRLFVASGNVVGALLSLVIR